MNQTETVQPEVTVMDFGIDGCYSQRAAEIKHKVLKLCGGSEVTVIVLRFVGSYVQSIAIRNQISMCSYS
jgi:hypothetical protein